MCEARPECSSRVSDGLRWPVEAEPPRRRRRPLVLTLRCQLGFVRPWTSTARRADTHYTYTVVLHIHGGVKSGIAYVNMYNVRVGSDHARHNAAHPPFHVSLTWNQREDMWAVAPPCHKRSACDVAIFHM